MSNEYRQHQIGGAGETLEVGNYGTVEVGREGTARAGDHGRATVGERGIAEVGEFGTAVVGLHGSAIGGRGAELFFDWIDDTATKRTAKIRVGTRYEPGVRYTCAAGTVVAATPWPMPW